MRIRKIGRIFILILFMGCVSKTEYDKLLDENMQLKAQIEKYEEIETSRSATKYVFGVIRVYSPGMMESNWDGSPRFTNWKTEDRISNVETISYFDENKEYQFLDSFESNIRSSIMRGFPVEIKDRKSYVFSSYAEASKERSRLIR